MCLSSWDSLNQMTKGYILWEVEAGRPRIQSCPRLHSKFKASWTIYLLLYTGVGTGIHMCREVRGQLCGVSSFLPPFLGSRFAQQVPMWQTSTCEDRAVLGSTQILYIKLKSLHAWNSSETAPRLQWNCKSIKRVYLLLPWFQDVS